MDFGDRIGSLPLVGGAIRFDFRKELLVAGALQLRARAPAHGDAVPSLEAPNRRESRIAASGEVGSLIGISSVSQKCGLLVVSKENERNLNYGAWRCRRSVRLNIDGTGFYVQKEPRRKVPTPGWGLVGVVLRINPRLPFVFWVGSNITFWANRK